MASNHLAVRPNNLATCLSSYRTIALSIVALFAIVGTAYAQTPSISLISPNMGQTDGSTGVILTGSNFLGATDVDFGAVPAVFVVDNDGQISTTAPAQAAGMVNVTVTSPGGTSTPVSFTYQGPFVTMISPNSGTAAGGNLVTVTGSGFTGVTGVTFGGISSPTVTFVNDGQITAVSPPQSDTSTAPADVVVTTPSGSSNPVAFSYDVPTITFATPLNGPTTGGTTITVFGNDFLGLTEVHFGADSATFNPSTLTNTDFEVTAPPMGAFPSVNITVTTPAGTSVEIITFNYDAPTLSSLTPNTGSESGGNSVILTGTNFTAATDVDFGSVPAASFSVDSATQITAEAPAQAIPMMASTLDVAVTVTTPTGTSGSQTYTYTVASAPLTSWPMLGVVLLIGMATLLSLSRATKRHV